MVYITVMQPPMYRQMTIEELLFGMNQPVVINKNVSNTRTQVYDEVPERIQRMCHVNRLIAKLEEFNAATEDIRSKERSKMYHTFYVPKSSGHGYRRIDAPNEALMAALRNLKTIFEDDFHALYHTSAFAYVRHRCTIDSIKRHQANESRWFGKFDLSNFFGNTTMDFVLKQFSMIYPFSEVMKVPQGRSALEKALELAFLNGGLPQGTPISPTITNIMMIPIDFALNKGFREFNGQKFVYTRYADDFLVSSRYDFNVSDVQKFIVDTLTEFGAPFHLNASKTRYGSSSGKNYNLGVVLNKDNQISVGYKKKRQFKAQLSSFVLDTQSGNYWDQESVQVLDGLRNYYRMVEKDVIDGIVASINEKYSVDIVNMIRDQLRS